ncbi:TPA: RNA-processing protein [Candidatus Woesearchaeota archaeon]|nr:RNA-processing protein [Candidatus Woesearchaeota archaeon]
MEEQEFSYDLKIPEERVAVLVGTDGETKKEIEQSTQSTLVISREGDVTITGKDAIQLYTAREIVRAVARGFNPKIALQLIKQDFTLEIIDLTEVSGKNKNVLERIKGRIIGKAGKARAEIERLTDTSISVYGKTVGTIGEVENVSLAHQAIGMLLDGAMHKTVYQFLERKRKDILFHALRSSTGTVHLLSDNIKITHFSDWTLPP